MLGNRGKYYIGDTPASVRRIGKSRCLMYDNVQCFSVSVSSAPVVSVVSVAQSLHGRLVAVVKTLHDNKRLARRLAHIPQGLGQSARRILVAIHRAANPDTALAYHCQSDDMARRLGFDSTLNCFRDLLVRLASRTRKYRILITELAQAAPIFRLLALTPTQLDDLIAEAIGNCKFVAGWVPKARQKRSQEERIIDCVGKKAQGQGYAKDTDIYMAIRREYPQSMPQLRATLAQLVKAGKLVKYQTVGRKYRLP